MNRRSRGRAHRAGRMSRYLRALCWLPLVGCLALPAAAQSIKIGYVNLARIEQESKSFASALKALNDEFEPRTRQLQEFQKRIEAARAQFEKDQPTLNPSEAQARVREIEGMMRESDQNVMRVSEEFELRRRQLRAKLFDDLRGAIKTVVANGKYDVILQEAVYVSPGTDVTGEVLKAMK